MELTRCEVLLNIRDMEKTLLRAAARLALELWFPGVTVAKSRGVVPGARLEFEDGGKKQAAVRTTSDRRVGLLRDQSGRWRTVLNPEVKLVLVAAPTKDDSDSDRSDRV